MSETNELIRSSTMLATIGMMDSAEATEALTAILNGFQMEASGASGVVDKLLKVDLNKVHYKSL